ncbi:DEAD/DEAH box helicase [Blastopirellula marina]|uniref:Helicase SNF2 n=1 Tax=Blastopirellula marina TaxID=124 RepID=A0A2S8G8V8_9BACT|nr:DEAD/DEAH box helicase [Blastopirellula marina]PQO40711.1 helicase SNF2 [Blastopirellula marina]PTL45671.1 helicase SNF2 [Blastopirellula marina]
MGLADKASRFFSPTIRSRGLDYADDGAVQFINGGKGWASFTVEGSGLEEYSVLLDWSGNLGDGMECTCPYFSQGDFCKHIWACLVIADRVGMGRADREEVAQKNAKARQTAADKALWRKVLDQYAFRNHRPERLESVEAHLKTQRQLIFRLDLYDGSGVPLIEFHQREQKKDGSWGAIKPFRIDRPLSPDVEDPEDRHLLTLLLGNQVRDHEPAYSSYDDRQRRSKSTQVQLNPDLYDTTLPALAATGRFVFWGQTSPEFAEPRPISWKDGMPWKFQIRADQDDAHQLWDLSGELARGKEIRPLADGLLFYGTGLALVGDELGRFVVPKDMRWMEVLLESETLSIPYADRQGLVQELWRTGEQVEVVGDASLSVPGTVGTPRGRIVIHPPSKNYGYRTSRMLYASVSYWYDKHEIKVNGGTRAWFDASTGQVTCANEPAEIALLQRLLALGMKTKEPSYTGDSQPGHVQFPDAELDRVVSTLLDEDWEVHAEGTRIRRGSRFSLSVRSGVDWFDLEGEVDFDGVTVTLPELLAALEQGEGFVRLGDGTRGILPQQWLDKYQSLAGLAGKAEGSTLRFQSNQALLLDAMLSSLGEEHTVNIDKRFANQRKRLQSFTGVKPVQPPKIFQGDLREYQQEGLGWLRFLEKFGFGGCLADDMGLGKTVQVLALLINRSRRQPKQADKRPSLVVAPNSVVHNWRQEANRFAPSLKVAEYTGVGRKKEFPDLTQFDLVLTTYGTLRKDFERLSQTPWDYAILDEAQAIKNASSQTAKASRLLDARHRLALSGTPIENHLGELWSLFEFLNPGLLGSSQAFKDLAANGTAVDPQKIDSLRQGLAPFLLRRTKAQVLPQLPEKSEQRLYCTLPPAQQKQYDQLRDHYRLALNQRIAEKGLAKAKIHVLEALLRLRQAACHPGLIDPKQNEKPSAKLDLLMEQLSEVVEEGHKALVFSQFTTMLDIVKRKLDKAGITYQYLDGKTRNRQDRVEQFQDDENCSVFLISLKAGGTGLNLTAADFVFLLDPWWNPAVEAQAIDRAHRIGQTRPVFAYRLIAKNTVEEKILELQAKKSTLAEAIISADSSLLKSLTAEDLQAILS